MVASSLDLLYRFAEIVIYKCGMVVLLMAGAVFIFLNFFLSFNFSQFT